jgi:arsenate reductase-like glutaredoxin family protein
MYPGALEKYNISTAEYDQLIALLRASGKKMATLDVIDATARAKDAADRTAAATAATTLRKNQITELYRTVLGRDPDIAGLDYWTHQSPLEINQIRATFINVRAEEDAKNQVTSVGNTNNTQSTNITRELRKNQITELYRTILKKEPDQAGLTYWINDSMTIDQIRATFINVQAEEDTKNQTSITNTESQNSPTLPEFVGPKLPTVTPVVTTPVISPRRQQIMGLYEAVLGRPADLPGLDYWDTSGESIDQIKVHFWASPEYQDKNK